MSAIAWRKRASGTGTSFPCGFLSVGIGCGPSYISCVLESDDQGPASLGQQSLHSVNEGLGLSATWSVLEGWFGHEYDFYPCLPLNAICADHANVV